MAIDGEDRLSCRLASSAAVIMSWCCTNNDPLMAAIGILGEGGETEDGLFLAGERGGR